MVSIGQNFHLFRPITLGEIYKIDFSLFSKLCLLDVILTDTLFESITTDMVNLLPLSGISQLPLLKLPFLRK